MELEFGTLKHNEIKEAVELAARAFEDYEYVSNFFPDLEERQRMLRSVIYRMGLANFKRSHFLCARSEGKLVATAMINDPQYKEPSPFQYILHGWLMVYRKVNMRRLNDWIAMDVKAQKPCHDYQKTGPDIWYGSSLAVDPSIQGIGVGTRFHVFIENYIREHGGKQYVFFTNSKKNRALYIYFGYKVFDECEIEHDGKKIGSWSMKKNLY